ncbi:MAG: hypothetical protein AVDCRST_MAG55-3254, partial [uncultured Rubrobacteraceae bacterium]
EKAAAAVPAAGPRCGRPDRLRDRRLGGLPGANGGPVRGGQGGRVDGARRRDGAKCPVEPRLLRVPQHPGWVFGAALRAPDGVCLRRGCGV